MVKEEGKIRRPSKDHGHPKERRMSVLSQTGRKLDRFFFISTFTK